jgi:hypothetical protein
MTFHEKTLWLLFLSLIAVFGSYFFQVLQTPPVDVTVEHVGMFIGVVVLLVILQIAGAILIAIAGAIAGAPTNRHETDERDKLINLKSTRNGAYVLATGVFFSLCAAIATQGNFAFTHLLLAFWVLAQLVETGSQLYHYRRDA